MNAASCSWKPQKKPKKKKKEVTVSLAAKQLSTDAAVVVVL